jgi:phage recombination protein Bet
VTDKTTTETTEQKAERKLSDQLKARDISAAQWHTLTKSLYPGAKQDSVLLVIDYCKARGLDPLKKPCHIVPIEVKVKDGTKWKYEWRDSVMPGIYELRTTAHRTGKYLGHTPPVYGPPMDFLGVPAPEFVDMTIRRATDYGVAEFPVRTYFYEVCGTTWDTTEQKPVVNSRWRRAPVQMMTKCCEAAGLREGFPEELGGQIAYEESDTATERDTPRPLTITDRSAEPNPIDELNQDLGITVHAEAQHEHEAATDRAE